MKRAKPNRSRPDINTTATIMSSIATLRTDTVILDDAQIKALPTSMVEVIPAPGSGKMIQFIGALWQADVRQGLYENINENCFGRFLLASGFRSGSEVSSLYDENVSAALCGFESINLVQFIPNQRAHSSGTPIYAYMIGPKQDAENRPLVILFDNGGADFTGGNAANTLKVTVWYVEVDV